MSIANPEGLSAVNVDHIVLDDEKLEIFRSRSVIRITTTNVKRNAIVEAFEKLLETIQVEHFPLGAFIPSNSVHIRQKELRSLERSVDRHFDSRTLQELSELTHTSIVKQSKERVCR